jgi:signal transduction histidine kinase
MLLYAGPFFILGTALLTVPLLGVRQTAPAGTAPAPPQVVQFPFTTWSLSLAALALVSVGLGWLVAGRFLRPLRTITATARYISASNLNRRLGHTGRTDEFAELAVTLDELFERLEAAFASQRHFVANASHELRTPLTAQRAVLQVALADPNPTVESLRAACQEVIALGAAQERLIDSLLTLARSEQGLERHEPIDLAEIAADVVRSRRPDAEQRAVQIDTSLATAPTTGDRGLVESLAANLVDNAVRHNVRGGRVEVATGAAGTATRLRVGNTGPVIAPDELGRLIEPFRRRTGDRTGHPDGHGLGLAIVRAIATAHRAGLELHTRADGGLDIEVSFPTGTP